MEKLPTFVENVSSRYLALSPVADFMRMNKRKAICSSELELAQCIPRYLFFLWNLLRYSSRSYSFQIECNLTENYLLDSYYYLVHTLHPEHCSEVHDTKARKMSNTARDCATAWPRFSGFKPSPHFLLHLSPTISTQQHNTKRVNSSTQQYHSTHLH